LAQAVSEKIGGVPASSVRSYLRLNTPGMFVREFRGVYRLRGAQMTLPLPRLAPSALLSPPFTCGNATLYCEDCFEWLERQEDNSIHAVVTDPPYGLHEYTPEQQTKLRNGKGGVWRIPPSFDGSKRSPLPRFTTLTGDQLEELREFFRLFGRALLPKLTPGANVLVASNPLLSHIVSDGLSQSGLERRGELVRLVMTLRGGDRPKAAHQEFSQVSVMPRSMWEPWLIYRKPLEGRAQDNLRKWQTGGFRRPSPERPFGDVIRSSPTRREERLLAPHPSLKPQAFLRPLVRGVLPLGRGTILDPFAGSGSTLAAAEAVGYRSIGVENDPHYFEMASRAIPKLATLPGRSMD
jgi:site-specific DNA-methyltransferase (adenine-specific)